LTLEALDLIFDPISKAYQAPHQMKANGGMFLIDDFGRQQVRPRDLLNRWIVPLEKRVDYLTLQTGRKIEIPFDVLIAFSTNLNPADLVDDAFLRRIRHKIEVPNPTWDEFREIFLRIATKRDIPFEEEGFKYLVLEHYVKIKREPKAVHPRDLLDQVVDLAKYLEIEPRLSKELIDGAVEAYFVKM
jgi:SpoVK/Ycf46/Vps4 family AAA+-type ATPase